MQVKCFCQGFHLFLLLVYYIQNKATKHQIEQLFIHIQKHKFINEKVLQLYMKCRMKCRPAKTLGRIENSSHRICVHRLQSAVFKILKFCRILLAGFRMLPDISKYCRISGATGYPVHPYKLRCMAVCYELYYHLYHVIDQPSSDKEFNSLCSITSVL